MLIAGEAGIGKSTLLAGLASDARQRNVLALTGAADDLPSTPPYGLWIDLFHAYPDDDRLPGRPDWFTLDSEAARVDSRGALFHNVHQFFREITNVTPLLLILEDLHRADTASLELLRYLNRRLDSLPLLLTASYRTGELTPHVPLYHHLPEVVREGSVARIELRSLDHETTRRLIDTRYRLRPDDAERLTRYVQQHAEGNPLFITELLRVLEDERTVEHHTGGWRLGTLDGVPIPPLVRQMVDGRLRRLDPNVRWLISIAAMLGKDIPFDVWRLVAGVEDHLLEQAVDASLEQNILTQTADGSLAFSHALFREVLRAGIILPRRRSLHRKIAETLLAASDSEHDPDRIAFHLWAARDRRAPEWLLRAGERARNVYAYEVAEERLTHALELLDGEQDALRLQALRSRGIAREMMGRFDQALEDLQAVLARARERGDAREIWQALIDLGDLWTARSYQEVEAYYQQALDLARETGDQAMLAHSLNRIGNWYTNIDQPRTGLQHHDEALRRFQDLRDDAGIASSIDLQAIAAYLSGDMPGSAGYYRQAIRLFREQNDLHMLANSLATLMLTGGSYDSETVPVARGSDEDWRRLGDEGLALARGTGWRATEAFILAHFGIALGLRGDYQHAFDDASQGLDLAREIDHREWITAGHFAIGMILADCLNTGSARDHLTRAHDSALAAQSPFWSRVSAVALAWVYLTDGDVESAENRLSEAIGRETGFESLSLRQYWFRRAELEIVRSNPATALEIAERLIATIPGDRNTEPVPHLEWLRGRALTALDRDEEARTALDIARERAMTLGYRPLLWRIDLTRGHVYERAGERPLMVQAFKRGWETVNDLASRISDTPVRNEFRDRALRLFPAGGGMSTDGDVPLGLSGREREVLALVARGMTDSETAEALHISPRTVGRHLQSIYNKLGVNSRTAAARLALERRLI